MLITGPEICHVDRCPHGCTMSTGGCKGTEFRLNHAEKYLNDNLAALAKEAAEYGFVVAYAVVARQPQGRS